MGIFLIIAAVFIGWYFYSSAANIGKNGFLWVGLALGAFLSASISAGLLLHYVFQSFFQFGNANSFLTSSLLGLGAGISGLSVVNHYMNIIPD